MKCVVRWFKQKTHTYLVTLHKNVAQGRADDPDISRGQYISTIEVEDVNMDMTIGLGLVFKNKYREVVLVLAVNQWYTVMRKDYAGIIDVTNNIKVQKKEEES